MWKENGVQYKKQEVTEVVFPVKQMTQNLPVVSTPPLNPNTA